jgi:hypothetical protein
MHTEKSRRHLSLADAVEEWTEKELKNEEFGKIAPYEWESGMIFWKQSLKQK